MEKDFEYSCPVCGAPIKKNAKACPECGSDERTGWSDRTYLDGIDLNDDFDYDETVKQEFEGDAPASSTPWYRSWINIAGIVLLGIMVLLFLVRGFF